MKVISIVTTINLDLSPQELAYIQGDCDYLCYLDSSLCPNKYSQFSYISWNPKFVLKSFGYENEFVSISRDIKYFSYQHPLSFLKQHVGNYTGKIGNRQSGDLKVIYIDRDKLRVISKKSKDKLPDFKGGFVGYFSYDLKNFIEVLPQTVLDDINIPLFYLAYYDRLFSYDHNKSKWYFIRNYLIKTNGGSDGSFYKNYNSINADSDYFKADGYDINFSEEDYVNNNVSEENLLERVNLEWEKINKMLLGKYNRRFFKFKNKLSSKKNGDKVKQHIIKKYREKEVASIKLSSNFTKKDYLKAVSKAKEYIHNGDIYQMCMTQRFHCKLPVEPIDLYYILREKNAAPFSAFLNFPEVKIGSSSPERFLFLKRDIIETRPIKGTRPRGENEIEDKKYIVELKNSIKDRAELNMIVDLERNDLGKFCNYGSVKVSEHAVIEKYAKVFHSVSTIVGKVREKFDIADILKAAFPGGSITGAPKIRAMQIIDELEPTVRAVYTGSIGYIGIDNTMDVNIVIRTFIIKEDNFYYNVGGGIVEDSVPEEEFQETLDKGLALQETLKFFESRNLEKLL